MSAELQARIDQLEKQVKELESGRRYNGHANYETWVMSMHIGGNYSGEGTYRHYLGIAQEVWGQAEATNKFIERTREQNAIYDLSRRLKEEAEQEAEDLGELACTPYADLLNGALSDVNWHDIAEGMIEAIDKSDEEEESVED